MPLILCCTELPLKSKAFFLGRIMPHAGNPQTSGITGLNTADISIMQDIFDVRRVKERGEKERGRKRGRSME